MKITEAWLNKLTQHIENGYIRASKHPTKPLKIYNYTQKTTYEGLWDEVTMTCRGLVLDERFNIIVPAPKKFFNQSEPQAPKISLNECEIYEKADGYYISIKSDPQYGLVITSRGSFDSQYAQAASDLLKGLNPNLTEGISYFCELLQTFEGDENIIVSRYTTPQLKCWAVRDANGHYLPLADAPFDLVKHIPPADLDDYLSQEVEGVVLFNPNTAERVKVKTKWFLDRHRLIANCTPRRVWEVLSSGQEVQDLDLPDEFYPTMLAIQTDLKTHFKHEWDRLEDLAETVEHLSDKELGLNTEISPADKGAIFLIRKDRTQDLLTRIWRGLRP